MNLKMITALLMVTLLLASCGSESEPVAQANAEPISDVRVVDSESDPNKESSGNLSEESSGEAVGISTDYDDALSIAAQLAVGTMRLEDTAMAVDIDQAESLLPLWQAYQSLSGSDVTADAELSAVLRQIQGALSVQQLEEIASMRLDVDSLANLMEEGAITMGRSGFGGAGRSGEESGGSLGNFQGGMRGQGFGQGLGGGPEGGVPGGLPPGDLDQNSLATRQAQIAEGDLGEFQDRILVNAVIRYLQEKTGALPEDVGVFAQVIEIVAGELDLTMEDLQSQIEAGETIAEIVNEHGLEVDALLTKLLEELNGVDQIRSENLEEFLRSILE